MIKIDHIQTFNFEGALRGLRNPMNSWNLSDSHWNYENIRDNKGSYVIGEKDLNLAQRMISAGTDESKFMRQIFVSMDIDAPLYWWKEMDTYKVATVANSCSTMHKITSQPITKGNFSFDEDFDFESLSDEDYYLIKDGFNSIVELNEKLRQRYIETKDKRIWRALIQVLPEGWNQKRTWTANYQVLRNIYFARRNHKLSEWHTFCDMIEQLPYGKELICYERKKE